jgi:hypothetical protein
LTDEEELRKEEKDIEEKVYEVTKGNILTNRNFLI